MSVRAIITIIITSLSVTSGFTSNSCNFNAKLKQTLLNEGFHRNITYGIVFESDNDGDRWLYEDCTVSLEQVLPSGVFVNPDELGEFQRTHKLNAIPRGRVNIELPASQSRPSVVYLMGTVVQSKVTLWLPVHARYHHAVSGGGNARNWIEPPRLFLRCTDRRLELCNRKLTTSSFLCNGSSKEKCSWMKVPFIALTNTLIWDVPVGNTNHYYLVALGTTLVIVVGSLHLMSTIHEYKVRARRKLT
ncbi:phosphatidylinositol-glycan biosynthesis class X protein [Amyelois transitella]|uniref:phosphatidylinositol-glycan biosynthesis class X protein n=1 Tax=Amyelois transitella TaxID=680683 RepID=UPI00067DFDDB|nr:phosphatidylinositol-glycan biosynthesis class X protein [Amyelois transitella]